MKRFTLFVFAFALLFWFAVPAHNRTQGNTQTPQQSSAQRLYLGFDANNYPGDALLPGLRRVFSFSGYWLNDPPGAKYNPWAGKRPVLLRDDFGFLILFNGRLEHELKSSGAASALGSRDAQTAVEAATRDGFHPGARIFLDQEEGGRMEPDQMAYILSWIDGVIASGFQPGVYCSGMPAGEGDGEFIVTANDIRGHLGARHAAFFVYNDACPPSPGCAYGKIPSPSRSGVAFAFVWQFAQSPRRKEFTKACSSTYNKDGNCYLPQIGPPLPFIDLDSASSADPSNGKR